MLRFRLKFGEISKMKNTFIISLALFVIAGIPCELLGWGGGHDHVNKLALTIMSPEIKTFLGNKNEHKFVEWSHAPDDFTPWQELKRVTTHAEDAVLLNRYGMKHPYALHSHKGHAVNFILLIKAFQAEDPERAAFWMATLMHTVADEIACNHDPLIHFMTYGFKEYGMGMGEGIGVDFADIAKNKEGSAVIHELLKKVRVEPVLGNSRKVLMKVMLSGIEGNAYMTQRGSRIAASYAENATDAVRRDSVTAMAELGVKGIQESLNIIQSAWGFARQGECPELDDLLEEEYKKVAAEFGLKRPLRDDSLFVELIDNTTKQQPYIGALVEPSVSMNQAKLGFSSKFITASTVRTIRNRGIACRLMDIRTVEGSAFPDSKTMPLLIVCAGTFHVSKTVKEQLQNYTERGGKLLWIGGEHKDQLGDLSRVIQRADSAVMPVSDKYGKDSPALKKAVIVFQSEFVKELGGLEYRFTHNPNTKAGWQKPLCSYFIKGGSANVIPLAEMKVDDSVMIVAAAGRNSAGAAQHIFLPEYLVSPYLLSDEIIIQDPSKPELDSVGTKIMLTSIEILMPGMLQK